MRGPSTPVAAWDCKNVPQVRDWSAVHLDWDWPIDAEWTGSVVGGGNWSTRRPPILPTLLTGLRITRRHGDRAQTLEVFGCGLGERTLSWESQGSEGQLQEAPRRPTTPLPRDAVMKCWQDGETSVRGGPPASGPAALPEVQQCPLQVGYTNASNKKLPCKNLAGSKQLWTFYIVLSFDVSPPSSVGLFNSSSSLFLFPVTMWRPPSASGLLICNHCAL